MEVYLLGQDFRRVELVDQFESMIWTERYKAFGDFQLVIRSSRENRQKFSIGTRLMIYARPSVSTSIMTIETVEDKEDSEGRAMLTITGRSLEAILIDRANRKNVITWVEDDKISLTGSPAGIARQLFKTYVGSQALTVDRIPMVIGDGAARRTYSIPEPDVEVTFEFDRKNMYETLKDIVDLYSIGFRFVADYDPTQIQFEVWTGEDRTTKQNVFAPVVFDQNLDNIREMSELNSSELFKNVAYVYGKNANRIVYAPGTTSSVSGFDRRVMIVDANDIELPVGAALDNALERRGIEALSVQHPITAIDGVITKTNFSFVYNRDYNLGDILEVRNSDGYVNRMRVTEQIFVDDAEGARAYPTLELDVFISPGTWAALPMSLVWGSADGTWVDYEN